MGQKHEANVYPRLRGDERQALTQAMPVKTDRNDARGIAQPMRLGWFRPVHCKLVPAKAGPGTSAKRSLCENKGL